MEGNDIIVLHEPLGKKKTSVKGFFFTADGIKTVTINNELSETVQCIVAAHELGHALLHSDRDIKFFQERTFLDDNSSLEKEANLFASELLLSDKDVVESIEEEMTLYAAAANLLVPVELLIYKIRLMNDEKGYNFPEPPLNAKNNFLLKMEVR